MLSVSGYAAIVPNHVQRFLNAFQSVPPRQPCHCARSETIRKYGDSTGEASTTVHSSTMHMPNYPGQYSSEYGLDFDQVCFVPFSVGMFWMRRILPTHWNLYYVQATRRSKSTIGWSLFSRVKRGTE